MRLRVAQEQKYVDQDWWEWAIWIEGPEDELAEVQEVTYKLHPTFRKPVRTVTDRASKFRLESEGWGGFVIRVKIELKNEAVIKLNHELELFYP
jgi:transcription initiation factor IIF auxiliary subunit